MKPGKYSGKDHLHKPKKGKGSYRREPVLVEEEDMKKEFSITKKIDGITHIPDTHLKEYCPPPKAAKVELTRKCNYKCSFCANTTLDIKKHMSLDDWRKICKKFRAAGVEEIAPFYYGESFLVPYLPEAIAIAKEEGFPYIFITTNGSVSTPEKVKACMEAGLNSLKFSFNFADEEQFEEVTRVNKKYFYKALQHVKDAYRVREEGNYNCGIYLSYIKYDGAQAEKMQKILDELAPYLDEAYALPLYNPDGAFSVGDWQYVGGNPGRADNMVPPVPCFAPFTEAHVNFDGSGNACCFYADNEGSWEHGNFLEEDFDTVWNSKKIRELRKAHLAGDVRGTVCERCVQIKKITNEKE